MRKLWAACVGLAGVACLANPPPEAWGPQTGTTLCGMEVFDGPPGPVRDGGPDKMRGWDEAESAALTQQERYTNAAADVDGGVWRLRTKAWQMCHDLVGWRIHTVPEAWTQGCQLVDAGWSPCGVVGSAALDVGYLTIRREWDPVSGAQSLSETSYAHEMAHVAQWSYGRRIDYQHNWTDNGLWGAIYEANRELKDNGF